MWFCPLEGIFCFYYYGGKTTRHMKFTMLTIFREHNSLALGTLTVLCNHHHHLTAEFPSSWGKETLSCSPSPLAIDLLLPVFKEFASYMRNHIVFVFLCLAYFT